MSKKTNTSPPPAGLAASGTGTPATKLNGGIFVREVRVRNYRSLRSLDVELDRLTLLVGQNNSGKSSFLSALFAAIGAGPRGLSSEDVFIAAGEVSAPKDRGVAIDILIRPTDAKGELVDVFPSGSPWLELWGSGIVQDDGDRDLVAIRTQFGWSAVKGEYVLDRRFLKDWQRDASKWSDSKPVEKVAPLSSQQVEPMALYLLDAKRDFAEDLRSRSSVWSKLVEDHGLTPTDVDRIEQELTLINKDIVSSSGVFTHIQGHLRAFHETLSCDPDSIAITPLARHLRDLSRGMDVVLATRGAPPFPLLQQGMGTRSLGAFFTFWAYTTWRQNQGGSGAVHPMMALEEPETHLHPQAQRALFRQIRKMPGQCIISTHSPYICGQAEIATMRHFSKRGQETHVSSIASRTGGPALTKDDLRRIDRQVMNTRGDMLFARALVFFEGETEEQALPDFAERQWGRHPYDLGYSFIGVGGSGNYLPYLRMAETFGIPWFIFSDGEPSAVGCVNAALTAIGQNLLPTNDRVVVVSGGKDFEACIASEQNRAALVKLIIEREAGNAKHKEALTQTWGAKTPASQLTDILTTLRANKARYGAIVGTALAVPPELVSLFSKVATATAMVAAPPVKT